MAIWERVDCPHCSVSNEIKLTYVGFFKVANEYTQKCIWCNEEFKVYVENEKY